MRILAALVTLAFLAASALAARELWRELSHDPATVPTPTGVSLPPTDAPARQGRPPRRWPALFGEPQPPEPQPPEPEPQPPAPEPQPPSPPKPPLDSLGYALSGMVSAEQGTWAVVAHPTGSRLVRVGDVLAPGIVVVRIDDRGLWVSRDGDDPELLAFPE